MKFFTRCLDLQGGTKLKIFFDMIGLVRKLQTKNLTNPNFENANSRHIRYGS